MTTKDEVLIKVENLQKHFGENKVLDGITTEIHKGEVVAIIGPSGSGKSTFLRSLIFWRFLREEGSYLKM